MYLLLPLLLLASAALSMPLRDAKNLPYFDYLPEEYYDMPMESNDISRTIPKRKPLNPYNSPIYYIRLPPQPYMFVPGLGYISQPPPPPQVSAMSPFVPVPIDFVANGKPSNIYQWAANVGGFSGEGAGQRPQRPDFGGFSDEGAGQRPGLGGFNGEGMGQRPDLGGFGGEGAGQRPMRPQRPQRPQQKPQNPQQGDSAVHHLDGDYNFNGKPENVFVLRDSYNALYGDALQNFYP